MSPAATEGRSFPDRVPLYQEITDRIIAELEAGIVPWVQPWGRAEGGAGLGLPRNAATGRHYSGLNVLILWGALFQRGFSSQSWLTRRQALALGGHVRKGEGGTMIVYAARFTPRRGGGGTMTARHAGVAGWLLGGSIIAAGVVAEAAGLRINTTPSLPRGLWLVVGDPDAVRLGDVVTFCPPLGPALAEARERGYVGPGNCRGGLEPMMKPVVALAGDTVVVSTSGVTVNGQILVRSEPLSRDGDGRSLPQAEGGKVAAGQVWVLSGHNGRSFDSRYFGPVPHAQLTAILRPLWTETAP